MSEYTPTAEDVEAVARVLAAIESRKGMKALDEVLAYQAEKWRRHTYEAEQLLDEMRPWLAAYESRIRSEVIEWFEGSLHARCVSARTRFGLTKGASDDER